MEYAELSFETLGDYPGISIDGDTLYVSSNAQAGSILIKTVLKPSFKSIQCPESGDVITKVTEINISGAVDRSKVMLNDIRIGNLSIPGFSPTKRLYNDVCVPYTYTPNDGGIAKIPEITWDIDNPDAAVTVSAPENVNGATVNINVSYDGIENNYVLKLKSVGQNLVANPGFEKDGGWDVNNFVKLNRVFDTPGCRQRFNESEIHPGCKLHRCNDRNVFPQSVSNGRSREDVSFQHHDMQQSEL